MLKRTALWMEFDPLDLFLKKKIWAFTAPFRIRISRRALATEVTAGSCNWSIFCHYTQNDILGIFSNTPGFRGNSGAPVLYHKGDVVCVFFSTVTNPATYPQCYLTSCFIPYNNMVRQVIRDIARTAGVLGVPHCGFEWEPREISSLGVSVHDVYPWSMAFGKLRHRDVVCQIVGYLFSPEGDVENTVLKPGRSSQTLDELVAEIFISAQVTLKVSSTNEQQIV